MWPLLRPGFRIRFRHVQPDTLAPGDLIVVERTTRSGETIVQVHRLIGRTGPLFLEAGDNTYSATLVTGDRIHGKVEKIWDGEGEPVAIPSWSLAHSRFRFFLAAASTFFFAHELKDRFLGQRKSLLLWKASRLYHLGLGALGLRVPTLLPRVER